VQTSYGFHIIQTEEKETARVKPFSEVRDSIEKALKQQKIGAFLSKQADQAQDVAQKQGLDKAAAQVGEQVVQSGLISSNDSLPGIGSSKELMNEIFATTEKAGPQMERAPQGYVVFQVTKIEPPKTPTFDEIKDRVASEFKNERANEMLTKRTQELADRAHADHDLAKAAKEAGATLKTSELVTRTAQVPDIGPMAGPAGVAFTLKEGEISGPINAGQKGVVLAVLERQEPALNGEEFAKERDQLREQLTEQKREQVLQLFLSNLGTRLEKQGKLKINNAEMNNLQKARS
jgi:peptidyl-prolyl cis-trans isomerase D